MRLRRNYTGYCNAEVDKLIDQQSVETDTEKRRQIVLAGSRNIWLKTAAGRSSFTTLGDLLISAGQGHHRRGQQPLQPLAHGGCLARPPVMLS